MPGNQADELRRQIQVERSKPSGPRARRIAVTSGKGGVGKSNFALNGAIALAALRQKVLLIDADTNLANLDILIGLNVHHDLSDVITGGKALRDIIVAGPGGIDIMPGSSGVLEMLDLDSVVQTRLLQAFEELEHDYRFIIIDTGAGLTQGIISYVVRSDEVILVTNPEPTSIADAYAMIKIITHHNPTQPIRLLVNLVKNGEDALEVFDRLKLVVESFLNVQIDYLGYLPFDPNIQNAVARQMPFILEFPKTQASVVLQLHIKKLLQKIG
jgi:flagellar biosynthesis protein FlhG